MTSVFCRFLSAPCMALAGSKGCQTRENQRWVAQDIAVTEVPEVYWASTFLQGMPWVICSCELFCADCLEVLDQEHGASVFISKSLPFFMLVSTNARFRPLVAPQRATEFLMLPGPGCTLEDRQHLLVLHVNVFARFYYFLFDKGESAMFPPWSCCVLWETAAC